MRLKNPYLDSKSCLGFFVSLSFFFLRLNLTNWRLRAKESPYIDTQSGAFPVHLNYSVVLIKSLSH